MKKIFTLFAVAVMAISAKATDVYSWSSTGPEGVTEIGGTISYEHGDGNRLNYSNSGYYTVCLNGKKANMDQDAPSANSGFMKLVLNEPLQAGDKIELYGFINKDNDTAKGNAYIAFKNADNETVADIAESDSYPNINDVVGDQPGTHVLDVPAEAVGCNTLWMTRNASGTNVFLITVKITREGGDTPEPVEGELSISPVAINPSWGTTFDAYKGSITCDGKVMEVSNFPFSGAKFSLDLVIRDGQQGSTRPIYKLIPQTGFTEKGEVNNYGVIEKLYAIDNQPEELVMTLDGVNSVKFVDYTFMFGSSTSAQFIPSETGAPYYETVILYLVGKYQQFADGAWGEVKNNGYINFKVDVPVTGATSSIDEVAVDFDENAPVEYYNLQGVRVAEPSNGVFIKRQGNKVVKVLVK